MPGNIDEIELSVIETERMIKATNNWNIPEVVLDDFRPPIFQKTDLPAARDSKTATIVLDRFKEICTLTNPAPTKAIRQLAQDKCSFQVSKPMARLTGIGWPEPIKPLSASFNEPTFKVLNAKSVLGRLAKRLYLPELNDVNAARTRIAKLIPRVSNANNNASLVEHRLALQRIAAEKDLIEGQESLNAEYQAASDLYRKACSEHRQVYRQLLIEYQRGDAKGLTAYFEAIGRLIVFPNWCEQRFLVGTDQTGETLIVEIRLPVLRELQVMKVSQAKRSISYMNLKNATKRETEDVLDEVYSRVLLRVAVEFAAADFVNRLKAIAVNGWVKFKSKTTGKEESAFVASLMDTPQNFREISLLDIDPNASFKHHNGQSAHVIDEVVPIRPQMVIDTSDPRFVAGQEVFDTMADGMNLATMDWEKFEHLIRELFEKMFGGDGVEVKVTQASRDRGVDAMVLDPDPIKGGKIVIQAKRYTNTVDVSSVRDLYGTVMNEGANKGILVTTSTFGPDAYSFASNKPLALVNGSELLVMMKQAGKNVRIDMEEARRFGLGAMAGRSTGTKPY